MFSSSFVTHVPGTWFKTSGTVYEAIGAGEETERKGVVQNVAFGLARGSALLAAMVAAVRESFARETTTIRRTGPWFFTDVVAGRGPGRLQLVSWDYTIRTTQVSIVVDDGRDSNWDDEVVITRTRGAGRDEL